MQHEPHHTYKVPNQRVRLMCRQLYGTGWNTGTSALDPDARRKFWRSSWEYFIRTTTRMEFWLNLSISNYIIFGWIQSGARNSELLYQGAPAASKEPTFQRSRRRRRRRDVGYFKQSIFSLSRGRLEVSLRLGWAKSAISEKAACRLKVMQQLCLSYHKLLEILEEDSSGIAFVQRRPSLSNSERQHQPRTEGRLVIRHKLMAWKASPARCRPEARSNSLAHISFSRQASIWSSRRVVVERYDLFFFRSKCWKHFNLQLRRPNEFVA